MKNIEMIPVGQLYHHPENPRLDLGDLTELAESIRQNGIMQNLTVVPGHRITKAEWKEIAKAEGVSKTDAGDPGDAWSPEGYTVVIGNRRMEAAKQAGLAEVPCVISDMDEKEQISTMLQENMQRADLTVFEQAQGFQMMMDLGFTAPAIAQKTGFSEATVRRRLKAAELDKDLFRKAVGKQISMDDLDRLAKIDSVKQRNDLLKRYGENNYDWDVKRAIQVQESAKMKPAARKMLKEAKIPKIDQAERFSYSAGWRQLYDKGIRLYEWDGRKNFIPKVEGEMKYSEDDTSISFYVKEKKKAEAPKKSPEEIEEAKKRDLAWKTAERIAQTAAELREQFVAGLTVSPKNAMQMMQHALLAAFASMMSYETPTLGIKKVFEAHSPTIPEQISQMGNKLMEMPQKEWPKLILMMFDGDWKENRKQPPTTAKGSKGYQMPRYERNPRLEYCYEWLTAFGYQMSHEEIEMLAGKHPVFQTEVEA